MAGAYLPPVVQELTLNIDDYLAKIEEAKAARDDFAAKQAETNEAMRAGGGGGRPNPNDPFYVSPGGYASQNFAKANSEAMAETERAAKDAAKETANLDKETKKVRQGFLGSFPAGVIALTRNLRALANAASMVGKGFGQIGSGFSSIGSIWSQPLSMLQSLVSFGKTWAIMVPTLLAAPALLAAIGGAAGGLAGSFTVLSSAIGIFALGAMKDLSYVTSVSNMAQFDALSGPLQQLYYAYHNLSNEFTIMTQTMGSNNTIISVLTGMFNTMGVVLQRIGPLMGEVASAGQAAFNILSGSLLGPQFENFVTWIGQMATPVLTTFSQTFVNLASGWAGLMEDLTPAINLFDQGMVHLTATFSNWANSPKGLEQVHQFVAYVQQAWPQITKFWAGLGHIFYEFFAAGAKGAPGMAAALGGLFTTIGNALPTLVRFGETVLPQIVRGFAQFTGGFFKGFGESLSGIGSALRGIDWEKVGVTVGKIAGDLVKLLPQLITVVGWFIKLGTWLGNLPGGVWALVAAWVAFKSVMALGSFLTGIGKIISAFGGMKSAITGIGRVGANAIQGLLTKLGLVTAEADTAGGSVAAIGGDATAAEAGVTALAAPFAAIAGAAAAAAASVAALAIWGQHTPVAKRGYVGGRAGLGYALGGYEGDLGNLFGGQAGAARARQTTQQINVQAPMSITVQGNADQRTVQQIQALLEQHSRQLAGQLVQLRGAFG